MRVACDVVAFSLISTIFAGALADGSVLARAFCVFLAQFWTPRLAVATFVFNMEPYLTSRLWRAGYAAMNVVFCVPAPRVHAGSAPAAMVALSRFGGRFRIHDRSGAMRQETRTVTLSIAAAQDRDVLYQMRHQVYASELHQHPENAAGRLTDPLDEFNTYLVAKDGDEIAGFVAITPPTERGYSVDKYFTRDQVPVAFDRALYEVRLLTVNSRYRRSGIALLLMFGALRFVEAHGGQMIVAIGRIDVLHMYERAGLVPLGLQTTSGSVVYELMSASVEHLRAHLQAFAGSLERLERTVDWRLDGVSWNDAARCQHGGAFFEAIGDEFDALERRHRVINADVLDAWFDPAPAVVEKLARDLPFVMKTSPPTEASGMRRAIARARGVPESSILPGAGSSALIFAALRQWVTRASRVLILDPMYGEYAHVLEQVIGARVDRFRLSAERDYEVDPTELAALASQGFDWVVLVNPNSPSGRHVRHSDLARVIASAPETTRFWIDETYVDYVGSEQSLERMAASSANVVICKSMSKVYALSGLRAAYLCGPARLLADLSHVCPPWAVSLPAQLAACEALKATAYYRKRWDETHALRAELQWGLQALGWQVVTGCANFLLCQVPADGPTSSEVIAEARRNGLFVRDVRSMGVCFDERALRIAVKDRRANAAMLAILRAAASSRQSLSDQVPSKLETPPGIIERHKIEGERQQQDARWCRNEPP